MGESITIMAGSIGWHSEEYELILLKKHSPLSFLLLFLIVCNLSGLDKNESAKHLGRRGGFDESQHHFQDVIDHSVYYIIDSHIFYLLIIPDAPL